jgi:regulator of protease activity HflC (stomatin/prohibitin superfamily)
MFKRIKILSYQIGLLFRDGEFKGLLTEGKHWFFDPLFKVRVDIENTRDTWLVHEDLDLIVKSGALKDRAVVLDLKDRQHGLVWIDGRFSHVLSPGLYAYWTGIKDVRVDIVDAKTAQFEHDDLNLIAKSPLASQVLDICSIKRDHEGVLFVDGDYVNTLAPGQYAFWRSAGDARIAEVDTREMMADISGQDIMTSDKVTLRLNAVATFRVTDAHRAISSSDDYRQSLYREAQLALRAVVGTRELDDFLKDKEAVATEAEELIRERATELGLTIVSVGIRDVILPGEMKDLMNKVTEAKKAAEANLISRREETAAMRSQANTAKLLADNPTLMRLKELELLEKIAAGGKLNISLGEKGLSERVVNLL